MGQHGFEIGRLHAELAPARLHWFTRLRSTNDHAALLIRRGKLVPPAVVLAGRQVAGRGRGENGWWSGAGGLAVTFVVAAEPSLPAHRTPLAAGLAVRAAAAELIGDRRIQLKWPNDVLFEGRKLAGLLCERVDGAELIGIGLNVDCDPAAAPAGLQHKLTSLRAIAGRPMKLTESLLAVARQLSAMLPRRGEAGFAELLREFDRHHTLHGREVSVQDSGQAPLTGRCEGLDAEGRLLIRTPTGLHRLVSGHVLSIS